MAKWDSTEYLDGSLDIIVNNVVLMAGSEGQPATLSEIQNVKGTADGKRLTAEQAMIPADFPKAVHNTTGRRIDVTAKNNVPIEAAIATPTPLDHVSLYDATTLYKVTTVSTPPSVDSNDQVNFPTWRIIMPQPI